jgi:hypothetical protein
MNTDLLRGVLGDEKAFESAREQAFTANEAAHREAERVLQGYRVSDDVRKALRSDKMTSMVDQLVILANESASHSNGSGNPVAVAKIAMEDLGKRVIKALVDQEVEKVLKKEEKKITLLTKGLVFLSSPSNKFDGAFFEKNNRHLSACVFWKQMITRKDESPSEVSRAQTELNKISKYPNHTVISKMADTIVEITQQNPDIERALTMDIEKRIKSNGLPQERKFPANLVVENSEKLFRALRGLMLFQRRR